MDSIGSSFLPAFYEPDAADAIIFKCTQCHGKLQTILFQYKTHYRHTHLNLLFHSSQHAYCFILRIEPADPAAAVTFSTSSKSVSMERVGDVGRQA